MTQIKAPSPGKDTPEVLQALSSWLLPPLGLQRWVHCGLWAVLAWRQGLTEARGDAPDLESLCLPPTTHPTTGKNWEAKGVAEVGAHPPSNDL